jgi:thiol-disulfide isomerase/thioredoxin
MSKSRHGLFGQISRRAAIALTIFSLAGLAAPTARANLGSVADGWNNDKIEWFDYEDGIAETKKSGKPVFVLVHTTWCPHCKRYMRLFFDPRVVELSKKFTMVMVDRDLEKELNEMLGPAGQRYMPRTLFLTPQAKLRPELVGANLEYPHFLDYSSPDELIRLMTEASKP